MRNRNVWVLIGAVILIAAVAAAALLVPQFKRTVEADSEPISNASDALADAYMLITVEGVLYEPIALTEECDYTIRRGEIENVIHVTKDAITMKSSTCENQDCVLQGTVSLENMSQRVLSNMIICLPNEVTLELHTPQSLADALTIETP